ncbi:MAG TPA: hypothetical protein GXZ23_00940 [Clostridiales bacterium]|nr:hypothetical protein [Clostridiales bacterium]
MKINPTVKKETIFVLIVSLILSALMEAIFLIGGWWNYTVLLGNILGLIAGVGNFLALGITLQKSMDGDSDYAKKRANASISLRFLAIFIICVIGVATPYFNTIATVIPLIFPRIAAAVRPLVGRKR